MSDEDRNRRHDAVCRQRRADGRCYACGDMRSGRSTWYCDRCLGRIRERMRKVRR